MKKRRKRGTKNIDREKKPFILKKVLTEIKAIKMDWGTLDAETCFIVTFMAFHLH